MQYELLFHINVPGLYLQNILVTKIPMCFVDHYKKIKNIRLLAHKDNSHRNINELLSLIDVLELPNVCV